MAPKKLNPSKVASVAELKQLISESKSVAIVDYKGLKVSQATQLRRDVKKAGGKIVVTKNTLFSLASGNKDLNLSGPSAFIFSINDEISAIKALADFSKKNSILSFKIGFLKDQVLSASELSSLAALPNKEILIGQTISSLKSPLFNLAYNLKWNISKLVRTLNAIKISKGVTN